MKIGTGIDYASGLHEAVDRVVQLERAGITVVNATLPGPDPVGAVGRLRELIDDV